MILFSSYGLKNGSSDWLYDLPETLMLVPRRGGNILGNSECMICHFCGLTNYFQGN